MERNRNCQEIAGEKQSFHILLPFPSHSHLSASLPFPTNPATRLQPSSCQSVCRMEGGSRQCRGNRHRPPCPADGDSVMSTTVTPHSPSVPLPTTPSLISPTFRIFISPEPPAAKSPPCLLFRPTVTDRFDLRAPRCQRPLPSGVVFYIKDRFSTSCHARTFL